MKKTYKLKPRKGTRKNRGPNNLKKFEQDIVVKFLEVLNLIKLYHWKTHSYATHKATDELSEKLQGNVDSFVEILLGKRGDRVNLTNKKTISLKDFDSVDRFKKELEKFKGYLVGLDHCAALKTMSNTDLYNIRDEMLGHINQFLYLLTFK
jgi:Family of unknown function (DUF5856)